MWTFKTTNHPWTSNYMTWQFPFSLALGWTGFLPLAITIWGPGIITLTPTLDLTLIPHSIKWSFPQSLKCHLIYLFRYLPLLCSLCPNPSAINCSQVSCSRTEGRKIHPRFPEWLLPTWHCKVLLVWCSWHFALEFLCAACLPIIGFCIFICAFIPIYILLFTNKVCDSHYLTNAYLCHKLDYFQITVLKPWRISLQLILPHLWNL